MSPTAMAGTSTDELAPAMLEAAVAHGRVRGRLWLLHSWAEGAVPSCAVQEQVEESCERASRVEEVARERGRKMLVELNTHCKIPMGAKGEVLAVRRREDGLISSHQQQQQQETAPLVKNAGDRLAMDSVPA